MVLRSEREEAIVLMSTNLCFVVPECLARIVRKAQPARNKDGIALFLTG